MRRLLPIVFAATVVVASLVQPVPVRATPCTAGHVCVTVDTATTSGTANLRAQGWNAMIDATTPTALLNALKPQWWRTADNEAPTYDIARAAGAQIIYKVVHDWASIPANFSRNYGCAYDVNTLQWSIGVRPPWTDLWLTYDPFIDNVVPSKAGKQIAFYDIENEPDITGCYPQGGRSPTMRYEQFKRAYHAIRADGGVPTAPAINVFANSLGVTGCRTSTTHIELSKLLDSARDNGLQWGAISWHELDDKDCTDGVVQGLRSPVDVIDHVNQVRALIAARQPQVGNPQIHINEYGQPSTIQLPGWELGFIYALEKADVDIGAHSCWYDNNLAFYDCSAPTAGGIFTSTGQTQGTYWVHRYYADMSCPDATCAVRKTTRVAATSTEPTKLTAFATRDNVLSRVNVLAGRHISCTQAVNLNCNPGVVMPLTPPDNGIATDLTIAWPYGGSSVRVTVKQIPNVRGAVTPTTVIDNQSYTLNGSNLDITIPAFKDGESYFIEVSPPSGLLGASGTTPAAKRSSRPGGR